MDRDGDGVVAAGTRRVDVAVHIQGGADPYGVPRAVREPRSSAGTDPVHGRHGREGIRHPDAAAGVQHQGVCIVKAPPAHLHVSDRDADGGSDRRRSWCATELDEHPIGGVAEQAVVLIHQQMMTPD